MTTTHATFAIGQRVRVRRRHTGMQYHYAGQEATVLRYEPGRGCAITGWYLLDTLPVARFYPPEQLERVRHASVEEAG